jgi:hypothetical protein
VRLIGGRPPKAEWPALVVVGRGERRGGEPVGRSGAAFTRALRPGGRPARTAVRPRHPPHRHAPYTPRWNGKVEHFHETMAREWAKGLRLRIRGDLSSSDAVQPTIAIPAATASWRPCRDRGHSRAVAGYWSHGGCPDRFKPGSAGPASVATPDASCRRSARAHEGSEPEPARPPGGAELLLLGGVLARRVSSLRRCCRAAEEVHFDPADQPVPELGVADAPPSVRRR